MSRINVCYSILCCIGHWAIAIILQFWIHLFDSNVHKASIILMVMSYLQHTAMAAEARTREIEMKKIHRITCVTITKMHSNHSSCIDSHLTIESHCIEKGVRCMYQTQNCVQLIPINDPLIADVTAAVCVCACASAFSMHVIANICIKPMFNLGAVQFSENPKTAQTWSET